MCVYEDNESLNKHLPIWDVECISKLC
jgi:hypothetical protein